MKLTWEKIIEDVEVKAIAITGGVTAAYSAIDPHLLSPKVASIVIGAEAVILVIQRALLKIHSVTPTILADINDPAKIPEDVIQAGAPPADSGK